MYYTVYKITNIINGHIYVGVHQTTNLGDGYMGSGVILKRAKQKYGAENFKKEIIQVFNTPEEMYEMESIIVNEDFIRDRKTYNVFPGGKRGDIVVSDYYRSDQHNMNLAEARKAAKVVHRQRQKERIGRYLQNPNHCRQCADPLPYEKRTNKFCSKSCAATFNNTGRVPTKEHKLKTSKTLRKLNIGV
jgi:hypothetical protein